MPAELFSSWTFNLPLPAPFDGASINKRSTSIFSAYCETKNKRSTLHGPTLQALLSHIDIDTSINTGASGESAIGKQGDNFSVCEYKSRTGEIHVVYFGKANGKYTVGTFADPSADPGIYEFDEEKHTGTALIFALIPFAMDDDEFREHYGKLGAELLSSTPDMDKALEAALILCDNIYRRTKLTSLGEMGLNVNLQSVARMTRQRIDNSAFNPTTVLYGTFQVLDPSTTRVRRGPKMILDDLTGKYADPNRVLSDEEKELIPKLPGKYDVSYEVWQTVDHIIKTKSWTTPFTNFMYRGPSGTGKTVGSQIVSMILGRPYVFFTCEPNTDQGNLGGNYAPKTGSPKKRGGLFVELPTEEDIAMDPASAYNKMMGTYDPNITVLDAYMTLCRILQSRLESIQESGQFEYLDTELVKGIRHGYVIEMQEMSIIKNQAVPVGLNALLDDRIKSFILPNGEIVRRHPDTILIVTSNVDYVGCKPMNQSVISRYHMKFTFKEPVADDLVRRVVVNSECNDIAIIKKMVKVAANIQRKCENDSITEGVCGTRELINWAISFRVTGNAYLSAQNTIVGSATANEKMQEEISKMCVEPLFAA